MEDIESSGSESGVNTSEGSSSPSSQPPAVNQTEGAPQDAAAQSGNDKPTPFHEHPRFKELIEQRNQERTEREKLQQSYQQMAAQMQQMQKAFSAPKPEQTKQPSHEQVLARLQQIDPEFGQFQSQIAKEMSAVPELKQQLEEFKQWKQDMQMQQTRTQAESTLKQLYEQNKVPEGMQKYYKSLIREMALDNGASSLDDLPKLFSAVHQDVSKFFEERDRTTRESYVAEKKKDVTPTTQSGGTPVSLGSKDKPMSTEDKIKYVAQELRRGKQSI